MKYSCICTRIQETNNIVFGKSENTRNCLKKIFGIVRWYKMGYSEIPTLRIRSTKVLILLWGGVSNNATLLVSVIRHGGYKTDDLLHLKLKKFKIRSYKAKNKIL